MDESLLTRVALACSIFGLAGLFFVSSSLTGAVVGIGGLTPESIGVGVKVCGNITDKHVSRAGHMFFQVADRSGAIDVVVFNSTVDRIASSDPRGLEVGNGVCVLGKLDIYKGELEILPRDIERA
ncbi:MAG: exodeoxyribonuclease VII large subunit [Candidatus Aenigmatarchaeota archaeon]